MRGSVEDIRSIEFRNFKISLDSRVLFESANFIIPKGKYQLLGRNGAGKSSLFNAMFLSNKNYTGDILIDGKDIKKIGKKKLRENYVSYVGQEDKLFDFLSVQDNLNIYCKKLTQKNLIIDKLETNLDIKLNQKVRSLSGGERQYINVLLSLTKDTPICFIDEPHNNLSEEKISLIQELIEESEKFLIVVDHRQENIDDIITVKKRSLVWGK